MINLHSRKVVFVQKSRQHTSYILLLSTLVSCFLFLPHHTVLALVDINTADTTDLEELKGIGPAKAKAIIDHRQTHGPFTRIEQIQDVWGIGPSTYENIRDFITVGAAYYMEPDTSLVSEPKTIESSTIVPLKEELVPSSEIETTTEGGEGEEDLLSPPSATVAPVISQTAVVSEAEKYTDFMHSLPFFGLIGVILAGVVALYANRLS